MDVIATQRSTVKLPFRSTQRGVAVIMALFIVTLAAVVGYALAIRLQQDVREAQWFDQHERVWQIAHGSLLGVMEQLRLSRPEDAKKEAALERFPMTVPVSEEQGYQVSSMVYDMGGLLNVNALGEDKVRDQFSCLFKLLFPEWQNEKRLALIRAMREWVTNTETQLDASYLKQSLAYRPRHGLMVSSSELRLVYGMDSEAYKTLRPFVTALPVAQNRPLNVMSAPPEVLACINPTMSLNSAHAVVQLRDSKSAANKEELFNSAIMKNLNLEPNLLTTLAEYFLVVTRIKKSGKQQVFYTFLHRSFGNEMKITLKILWQSKGVY